jgi:diacylglycerol kinase
MCQVLVNLTACTSKITFTRVVPAHLVPLAALTVEPILSIHTVLVTATITSQTLIHTTAISWLILPGSAVILIITHLLNANAHLPISTVKLGLRVTLGLRRG